jgi:acyl-CoA dehydrogenase
MNMAVHTPPASEPADDDLSAILLDQADRLLQGHVTPERLAEADRGVWPGGIWQAVEEAGLPLALLPETAGGVGLTPAQALSLVIRSAYHALPLPLAETMLAVALWGEAVAGPVTLASGFGLRRSAAGYELTGTAQRVPWGAGAGHVLVHVADVDGARLALLPASVFSVVPGRNIANEPRDALTADGIALSESAFRPAPAACAEGFLVWGALLRAAQMVGAMERSLDHALRYANERRQFGRPIAKFQAIQHMLAQAAGHYAAAVAAVENASDAAGHPLFELAVAIAKSRAGEAAGKVAAICHQVHGAMGFTQEHPLHFSTRRLWSWRDEFGGDAYWEKRIGRTACAAGGDEMWDLIIQASSAAPGTTQEGTSL